MKGTILKATIDIYYYIEGTPNGWDIKEVIKNWFTDFSISKSHASRDVCKIGGSERLVDIKEISEAEYNKK